MMKKKLFILSIVALALASCSDDLEETVYSNLTDDTAFTTAENAQAAVDAMYGPLQTIYRDPMFQASDGVTDICYDNGVSAFNVLNDDAVRTSSHLSTCWNGFYQISSRANIVIDRIPDMSDALFADGYDKTQMLAEAHFMRAYAYMQLTDLFYQVPLVLTSDIDVSAKLPYADIEDIEEAIEADLKAAQADLPATYASHNDGGRPTSGAATGFLVRLYMRQAGRMRLAGADASAKWNLALTEVNKLLALEGSTYSLQDHEWDVFNPDTEASLYNNELIFAVRANNVGSAGTSDLGMMYTNWSYDKGWALFLVPLELYWKFDPADERVSDMIVTEFPDVYNGSNAASNSYYIAPSSIDQVSTLSESNQDSNGNILPGKQYGTVGELAYVFTRKYEYHNVSYTYQTHNNMPIMRLADMILCKAEILNELNGPTQAAVDCVNRIRERAFQNTTHNLSLSEVSTKDALRSAICDERALELYLECNRRVDLVRMGLWKDRMDKYFAEIKARVEMKERNEGKASGYYASEYQIYPTDLTEDDVRRYMPIPKRETDYNPDLMNARTFK